MKVLFLCGGIGKRMFPLTEDKFLLKFLGKTLLEHQLDTAVKSGLNRFIIVANPFNLTRIENIAKQYQNAEFEFVVQEKRSVLLMRWKSPALAQRGSVARQPE